MRRIFVSLEPYYFDCYEEGGRKRRRTLVFSGVIKDIIKGVSRGGIKVLCMDIVKVMTFCAQKNKVDTKSADISCTKYKVDTKK